MMCKITDIRMGQFASYRKDNKNQNTRICMKRLDTFFVGGYLSRRSYNSVRTDTYSEKYFKTQFRSYHQINQINLAWCTATTSSVPKLLFTLNKIFQVAHHLM